MPCIVTLQGTAVAHFADELKERDGDVVDGVQNFLHCSQSVSIEANSKTAF